MGEFRERYLNSTRLIRRRVSFLVIYGESRRLLEQIAITKVSVGTSSKALSAHL